MSVFGQRPRNCDLKSPAIVAVARWAASRTARWHEFSLDQPACLIAGQIGESPPEPRNFSRCQDLVISSQKNSPRQRPSGA